MAPTVFRRNVIYRFGVLASIGLAGCLGGAPGRSTPSEKKSEHRTLTDEEAEQRAIDAEESYLFERLRNASCLTGYGTMETTGQTTATVSDRTTEDVVVEVTHAYWYRTEELEADGESEARYVVTVDEARRIDGDSISPC